MMLMIDDDDGDDVLHPMCFFLINKFARGAWRMDTTRVSSRLSSVAVVSSLCHYFWVVVAT